ncbi:murein hydrolase activator EnvC family protein [Streptomyces tubercidicus]|uniref:murein hydrolase activator EnvC family protein n=2 Tax=Streptomyces tubercidicus TaxID=47759 RepID=UPI003789B758
MHRATRSFSTLGRVTPLSTTGPSSTAFDQDPQASGELRHRHHMRRITRRISSLPPRYFPTFTGLGGRLPRPGGGGHPQPAEPGRRPRRVPGHHPSPGLRPSPRPSPPPRPLPSPRPRSRFRSPAPLPPTPRRKPNGYGPSCFFPAHPARALLAPTAAAVLTLFTPTLASAAALPAGGAVGRGAEQGVERGESRGVGLGAGRTAERGAERGVGLGAGRTAERRVERRVERRSERGPGLVADRTVEHGVQRHVEREAKRVPGLAAPPAEDRSWPVEGPAGAPPTVVRGWNPPPTPWAAGHRGVDLAASAGAVVRAAAPGQVSFTGTVAGRGVLTIEVSRSGRPPLRTSYEPVRSTVRKGQRVTAGQPVAVLRHDGPFHCREPCLHWGLRRGKTYLDPLSLLPQSMLHGAPSRLLPIFGIPLPGGDPAPPRHPERPEPTAHERSSPPTATALIEAAALAAVAIWALGRLPAARNTGSKESPRRRRGRGWAWRILGRGGD